jgi:hypothetical protein
MVLEEPAAVGSSRAPRERMMDQKDKQPLDIEEAVRRIRKAVEPFPKAAMFALADEGYDSARPRCGCSTSRANLTRSARCPPPKSTP